MDHRYWSSVRSKHVRTRSPDASHGESPGTSTILFEFLNKDVVGVSVDAVGQMTFDFGAGKRIRIIPDSGGLEAYVLRTLRGTFPVY